MKRILLLLLIASLYSCFSPERDCGKFKTGTFEFQSYLNGELVTSTFVRNDTLEIDQFQGKTDTSSIRWINNCEYIITNLHPKSMAEKKPLNIKILTTKGNTYTFEYGQVGDAKRQRGTVTKID
ncbi:hypothetical protein [Gillisia sp. Hel_I_29]|uniref:hypothetical protein n=1 Tax=Gillisia sp. Hel_I_29 TaxID=1249975 RepID=UPI0005532405|nr:hypothetical protein [Gillisia sp. Hel_I_29]